MDLLARVLFFGGAGTMIISIGFILILGHENSDIIGISKEIRVFVSSTAFMTAGIGVKVLFT
jgi:hypothetical protein